MALQTKTIVIIVGVSVVLLAAMIYLKDSSTDTSQPTNSPSPSPTPDSPSPTTNPSVAPPVCGTTGNACVASACCSANVACVNGQCVGAIGEPIISFLLQDASGNCISALSDGYLGATTKCNWVNGVIPQSYWYWDGISQLILKTPIYDADGNVSSIKDEYINYLGEGYCQPTVKHTTGVLFTKTKSIYSLDYTKCLSVDSTGHLVWATCLGTPYQFSITEPTGCSTGGSRCTSSKECCPPFNSCVSGVCSTCFGSPETFQGKECPGDSNYAVCDTNGVYKCKSKCDGQSVKCLPNQKAVCQPSSSSSSGYALTCVSMCSTEVQPICNGGTQVPVCTLEGKEWDWKCPINPCDLPPPSINEAPVYGNGYELVNDHYELPKSSLPWQYPMWDCHSQKWNFTPGCNATYKQECGNGTVAVCNPDTSFEWQCANKATTDYCGLTSNKHACGADAQCFNISSCGGGNDTSNDWQWICPSSATQCQLIKMYDWVSPPTEITTTTGSEVSVVFKDETTPIFPSVNNTMCRSGFGSDTSHPNVANTIGNPSGNILGSGAQNDPFTFVPAGKAGPEYVVSDYPGGWQCLSKDPCYPNGKYAGQNVSIAPPNGVLGPPSGDELLNVNKCNCNPGHVGNKCQYGNELCGNGSIEACNTPGQGKCTQNGYMCGCKPGYYGLTCQFTPSQCNGFGIPNDISDTLKCDCHSNRSGPTCRNWLVVNPETLFISWLGNGAAQLGYLKVYPSQQYFIPDEGSGMQAIGSPGQDSNSQLIITPVLSGSGISQVGLTISSYNDARMDGAYVQFSNDSIAFLSAPGQNLNMVSYGGTASYPINVDISGFLMTSDSQNYLLYTGNPHSLTIQPVVNVKTVNDMNGAIYLSPS
jgi:hypothetical protein